MTNPRTGGHGQWLREQRQARGWNIQQMARKLRDTAALAGDALPGNDCLATMVRRWEKGGGVSERYRLHYCHAFQIPLRHFGGAPAPGTAPAADSTGSGRQPVTVVRAGSEILSAVARPSPGTTPARRIRPLADLTPPRPLASSLPAIQGTWDSSRCKDGRLSHERRSSR